MERSVHAPSSRRRRRVRAIRSIPKSSIAGITANKLAALPGIEKLQIACQKLRQRANLGYGQPMMSFDFEWIGNWIGV